MRFTIGNAPTANPIEISYDPLLVVISVLMAIFASYAACYSVYQLKKSPNRSAGAVWLATSSISMGCGIWSMHFLGMLAIKMPDAVRYDGALTAVSVLFAILGSGIAFQLLRRSDGAIRTIVVAGAAFGAGIGAMHYTGMAAMNMQALIVYDPGRFAASIIIAVGLSVVALKILFLDLSRSAVNPGKQLAAASAMGLAVSAMHYTGMAATSFIPSARQLTETGWDLGAPYIAMGICLGFALLIASTLAASMVSRRLMQQEARIQQSEGLLRAIINQMGEGVIAINERGTIEIFNSAAVEIFGYEPEDVIGADVSILLPEEQRHDHKGYIRNSDLHGTRIFGEVRELKGQRKDGSRFPMTLTVTSLTHDGARLFVGVCRDETERLAHQVELIQAKDEAEEANRAKTDFLASMSHEIRTPLNGVLGMANALIGAKMPDEQKRQAKVIRESGKSLLALLNDILDLSKIEAGRFDLEIMDFDLNDLLDSVEALWKSQILSKGLDFRMEVAPDIPSVIRSDPSRIRQVIFNLISNAAKFTDGGHISFYVSCHAGGGEQLELRFSVADTGVGIPLNKQQHVFSKFAQADTSTTRKYGGTGLGLAICEKITELLGGEIGLESVPEKGSTFWFTVCCERGNPSAAASGLWSDDSSLAANAKTGEPLRILVAEDNHINQQVIMAILGKAGHRIDMVANGFEAVVAVLRQPYDIVLMDVQMPEMDGVTATGKIRDLTEAVRDIPIIALTANSMKGDRERYLEAGMSDYVSKPIRPQELFAAIERHTGSRVAVAKEPPENLAVDSGAVDSGAVDNGPADDAKAALEEFVSDIDELIKSA